MQGAAARGDVLWQEQARMLTEDQLKQRLRTLQVVMSEGRVSELVDTCGTDRFQKLGGKIPKGVLMAVLRYR